MVAFREMTQPSLLLLLLLLLFLALAGCDVIAGAREIRRHVFHANYCRRSSSWKRADTNCCL